MTEIILDSLPLLDEPKVNIAADWSWEDIETVPYAGESPFICAAEMWFMISSSPSLPVLFYFMLFDDVGD